MLRTANISMVPIRFCRVSGNRFFRALWCIMWNATMKTSQMSSCVARTSVSWVKSSTGCSVMPMCLILPLAFCSSRTGPSVSSEYRYSSPGMMPWSWNTST